MICEAILIPKIYARLQEIASNFSKFSGEAPQTPAGDRAFGAWFGASFPYRPPFPKFLDPPLKFHLVNELLVCEITYQTLLISVHLLALFAPSKL